MAHPAASPESGSTLFSERVLVVREKPEVVDSTPLYAIFDQSGARLGSVADVGQGDLGRALRRDRLGEAAQTSESPPTGLMAAFKMVSSTFGQVPYRLEVRNEVGVAVLVLTPPDDPTSRKCNPVEAKRWAAESRNLSRGRRSADARVAACLTRKRRPPHVAYGQPTQDRDGKDSRKLVPT